ncbi:hypothetical protein [Cellulomonas soli]
MLGLGVVASVVLLFGPVEIGSVGFDVSTMIYATAAAVLGYQAVLFSILTKVYAEHEGFLPAGPRFRMITDRLTIERGLLAGIGIFLVGLVVAVLQVVRWGDVGFGELDARAAVRVAVPAALGLMLGFQTMMSSMVVGILTIPTRGGTNPAAPETAAPQTAVAALAS